MDDQEIEKLHTLTELSNSLKTLSPIENMSKVFDFKKLTVLGHKTRHTTIKMA